LPYIQVDELLVFPIFQKIACDLTIQYKLAQTQLQQGGVTRHGLAIYIKMYLKAKEELWKLKYFTMQKLHNLQKIL
jgi:hypothetical protein